MAKRYISTELISEDWYLELSSEVKLFFVYATLKCDHAGFLKVNLRAFNALHETALTAPEILEAVNEEKTRFRVISDRLWLLEDFIPFQYGNSLNPNNRVHASIISLFEKHGVSLDTIKGLDRGSGGVKDKDKEKDKDEDIDTGETVTHTRENRPEDPADVAEQMKRWLMQNDIQPEQFDVSPVADKFFNHYETNGWKRNGTPVYKWIPLVSLWMANEKARILKELSQGAENNALKTEKKWHKK